MRTTEPERSRILIVRLSAVGDVVHGMPVLCALRDHLPDAFLAWVVEGRTGDLLEGHAAVDELVRVPRAWRKSPKEMLRLRRRLRALRFDVAIDLQGLTKSAVAAWSSGAADRIGFAGVDGRELSSWLNNELVHPGTVHVIDRNLELLQPLGIRDPAVRFDVPRNDNDVGTVDNYLREAGISGEPAVINPGAGWPSKLWPTQRYAAVARHLGTVHRLPSVVPWAGEQELSWAQEIVDGSDGYSRLAPTTSLTELAVLAGRAQVFIGSDTGPLHLAAAVGATCVGLFGPTPYRRNGPYGPAHVAIQKMTLSGSKRERRAATNASMLAIQVGDVCDACDSILGTNTEEQGKVVP